MIGSLVIGETFSGCKLLQRCGKGSYGIVFLAENAIGQKIIIKVVDSAGKFDRELRGVRYYMRVSGSHPNLLQIFHIGEMKEGFYYTMEAGDDLGEDPERYQPATLGNMLRNGRRFTPEEALRILRELLQGLEVLHNAHLVHRDIKPDNIIFVQGKPKLSDPGLVTEADTPATLVGTPGFIPQENITRGITADQKSDLYAIGKVFYCMITGNPPGEYPHLPETLPLEIRRQIFPVLSRMCNNNPAKRFATVAEMLGKLPEKFQGSTFLEKKYKAFADWRTLNREKCRWLAAALYMALLLVLLACGALFLRQRQQTREVARQQKTVADFCAVNENRKELIPFQFQTMLPEQLNSCLAQTQRLEKALQQKDWAEAAALCRTFRLFLRSSAKRLLPFIPEKQTNFQQDTAIIGKARGMMTTPLYAYLTGREKNEYQKKLEKFERKVYTAWQGPRCNKKWSNFQNSFYPMVFVPPGAVRMKHDQKIIPIPYHFWIGENEVSHAHFTRMMQSSPQYSPHAGTPVERILWNDLLYYCYKMSIMMRRDGTLPPGYIVRPPTEAEWEYAAKNAWLGKDILPVAQRAVLRNNSGHRTHPSGSKSPNLLGINDIYGNVQEIVLPLEEPGMKHAVIVRGGSFLSPKKNFDRRIEYQKYQNIPYDIGFRIAIGPGDMAFFDKHFFLGGANQLRSHGRVFELIGENYGCFDIPTAKELCRLLGGRLAELDQEDLLHKVWKAMPLTATGWGCFLGGERSNGKWYWTNSRKEVDFGKWAKNSFNTGKYLTTRSKLWKSETNRKGVIFLCEWDEKTFPERNKALHAGKKLPLELLRFTVRDRRFMLIDSSMAWYTARRFCELLGGRLACLDDPEIRNQVLKKLEKYNSSHILLGGYAKRNSWYWLSGKKITFDLTRNKDMVIQTVNRNFVTLKEGVFYNSQFSDLFLCEWIDRKPLSN